ncbi:MAG TPA: ornithine cyclodeaminase family protein [Limnochordales bacterium]
MLLLTEQDVQRLLTPAMAIEAVEAVFRRQHSKDVVNVPRSRLTLPAGVFRTMSAGLPADGFYAVKLSSIFPRRRGPMALLLLYDADAGEAVSMMEADWLGQMRTGAATAVATKYMAHPDWEELAVIGTGTQATTQILALAALKRPARVRVYSRDPERRTAFAQQMGAKLGLRVEAADSVAAAVAGAHVVVTATTATAPVLAAADVSPGMHINAMGANLPGRCEVEAGVVARAAVVAVDDRQQAEMEAGDLIHAAAAGAFKWDDVVELGRIVRGEVPGRRRHDDITFFKSIGVAMEDVAAARAVYLAARAQGAGRAIDFPRLLPE